ncbi:hypothetical protein DBR39_21640 [Chryseobacterium sp. KBW03]|jgi:uncharacterized protein (DUF1330 family)|uniref:hypothetical protein n=1 Tax=unclassified Chryseobacterium TaxID=2593645 RepID=UPI000F5A19F1|nr:MULTISPECIES: hypothetical protein [unclassified Chryseobacterium]RQO34161.1 hypothetical protein DBR39_21640 [Chryseobacterium sp. KBW03]UKB80151.1 hypothetical protein LF886_03870 [Chryseobacterium sp. MEBOG07]
MKTKTLFLIGAIVGLVIIFSQLKPQEMTFYKEKGNYIVDNNYIIKDVKKISDEDMKNLLSLQKLHQNGLGTNFIVYKINRQYIIRGCLIKANIDWKKYGDLRTKVDDILKKYGAKELRTDYYAIQNNQVATNAALLSQKDIASLSKLTIRGAEEYTICPPTMGRKNLTNVIIKSIKANTAIDPRINVKLNNVLVNYK